MQVPSLDWEDPLEKEMATHSSILTWKIPGTEKPGRLPWGHEESDRIEHTHKSQTTLKPERGERKLYKDHNGIFTLNS